MQMRDVIYLIEKEQLYNKIINIRKATNQVRDILDELGFTGTKSSTSNSSKRLNQNYKRKVEITYC